MNLQDYVTETSSCQMAKKNLCCAIMIPYFGVKSANILTMIKLQCGLVLPSLITIIHTRAKTI